MYEFKSAINSLLLTKCIIMYNITCGFKRLGIVYKVRREMENNLLEKKVLILIVAYNAEKTIQKVLSRIPEKVFQYNYEILILDDQSKDNTFTSGTDYQKSHTGLNIKVLYNPKNQGYGGNQKIGYHYAIANGFDAVVLLHGDGQYAPEIIEEMFLPVLKGEAEAVFGSRMAEKGNARKGGMPLYKYIGNRILTSTQNFFLGLGLSEYHSGYRVYSIGALKKIHFSYNTNDFHFDTEIIIQLWLLGARIAEIPIPTYYGDEICHVNGLKYAWNVFKQTVLAKMQGMQLCYERKYDIEREDKRYPLKLGFVSSHTEAISEVRENSKVLDIGCAEGYVGLELQKKGCEVWGIDDSTIEIKSFLENFRQIDLNKDELPYKPEDFDFVLLLDVLEHLNTIAIYNLLDKIRDTGDSERNTVLVSSANVAFIIVRMQMLLGNFNYGKRGILDYTHRHLFTRASLVSTLEQCGFEILEVKGIPAPFPAAFGDNWLGKLSLALNRAAIFIWPEMFSYQFFIKARPFPTLPKLLNDAQNKSRELSSRE